MEMTVDLPSKQWEKHKDQMDEMTDANGAVWDESPKMYTIYTSGIHSQYKPPSNTNRMNACICFPSTAKMLAPKSDLVPVVNP
jgi:hypothetical protein